MKKATIFLSILSLVLVAIVWRNQQAAEKNLQLAAAEITTLSNKLETAEMKVNHQERMNASLDSQLTNNAVALKKSAENLATVRDALSRSQAETGSARQQVQAAQAALESTKGELAGLMSQIKALRNELAEKDREVAKAKTQSADAEKARQNILQQLAQSQIENDKLNRKLGNPTLLRAQLDELEKRIAAAKHAQSGTVAPDLKLNLELQPDGSVRPTIPPTSTELRELEQELRDKLARER